MDNNYFGGKKAVNSGYRAQLSKSYARRREEEEKRRLLVDAASGITTGTAEVPSKNLWDQAKDVAGTVGNFAKEMAVDVYDKGKETVLGAKEIGESQIATNKTRASSDVTNKVNKEWSDYMSKLTEADYEKPEVQKKLQEFKARVDKAQNYVTDRDRTNIEEGQEVDPKKLAAAAGETFLNVATLGTGTIAKQALKTGVKGVLKAGGRAAGEGAAFGAGAGAADAMGSDEDILEGAGQGALFGAALGGLAGSAGRVVGNMRSPSKLPDDPNAPVVDEGISPTEPDTPAFTTKDVAEVDIELTQKTARAQELEAILNDPKIEIDKLAEARAELDALGPDIAETTARRDEMAATAVPRDPADIELEERRMSGELYDDDLYDNPRPDDDLETVVSDLQRIDPKDETGLMDELEGVGAARDMIDEFAVENDIMTPDRHAVELERMNQKFDFEMERIQGIRSDTVRKAEQENLDLEYAEQYDFINSKLEEDAQYADMLQQKHDYLDEVAESVADRIDALRQEAAPDIRRPNQQRIQARQESLKQERKLAEEYAQKNSGENKLIDASTRGRMAEAIDDPDVEVAAKQQLEEVHSLPDMKSSESLTIAKKLLSPSHIFASMGLRRLHTDVVNGVGKANNAIRRDGEVIKDIQKEMKDNDALGDEIVDYLEGKTDTISTTNEEAARKIKAFLDEKRNWLKDNGYNTREDYFPHMFDQKSERIQELFGDSKGEYSFGAVKERKFEGGDYNKNIVEVLSRYSQGFNRLRFMNPAMKNLEEAKFAMKDINTADAKFIGSYIDQIKAQKKDWVESTVDEVIDFGLKKAGRTTNIGKNHARNGLALWRMGTSVAIMGGNVASAVRNSTAWINNLGTLGPKYAKVGAKDMFDLFRENAGKKEKSALYNELIESGIYDGGLGKGIDIDETDLSSIVRGKADKLSQGLMIGIRTGDIMARTQAYLGARAKGIEDGLTGQDLVRYATETAMDAQFITSKVDMPIALNGATMRTLTQLMSYTVKQAEYLGRMGISTVKKKEDGSYTLDKDGAKKMIGFITASAGTAAVLGPLMGFRPMEMVPFADQFEQGSLYRAPIVKVMFGDGKGKDGIFDTIGKLNEAKTDEERQEILAKLAGDNWGTFVPAGTQIKKSAEGYLSGEAGESRTARGNLRFYQDQDISSRIQAAVFGQYSTKSGREWLASDMPSIKADTTVTVDGRDVPLPDYMKTLPIEKREQYYNYFAAKQGLSDEMGVTKTAKRTELVDNLRSGKITKEMAAREAKDYNRKVMSFMKKNYGKSSLPDRLAEDMNDSLLLDVFSINKSAERVPSKNAREEQEQFYYDDLEG